MRGYQRTREPEKDEGSVDGTAGHHIRDVGGGGARSILHIAYKSCHVCGYVHAFHPCPPTSILLSILFIFYIARFSNSTYLRPR
jgi:hypothetical protein